ncbi:MAG: hypothetical protein ACM4D3_22155 [Candidatus Sericytochromatia bacterium]
MTTDSERHRVAVIRVEVREPPDEALLIEVLEVGRLPRSDRLLGAATTTTGVCHIIERWLREVASHRAPPGIGAES